jgi:Calx-beta domain
MGTTSNPSASGSLQLSAATYSVAQSAGELMFAVNRSGGSANSISVSYSTSNGSAVAGTDFTSASGQLDWADSDTAAKTVSVAINSAATFSGTKTFTIALSAPGGGAGLGTPSSAVASITGSGPGGVVPPTGTGAPSAVSNLQLINQGGTSNGTNPLTNVQQISWSAATAGANAISYYRIYRNGKPYATTTALTYADNNATNSNDPTWATATTVYSYNVTAVDTAGTEGPQASQVSVYSYRNGKSNWSNYDLSYGGLVEDYTSTAGSPVGGQYDIQLSFPSGGFQPTAHAPQAPIDDLEIGAFKYLTVDVNPGPNVNYTLQVGTVSRLPPGDVYGWGPTMNAFDYGPKPVANTWATYKIPLAALNMGICPFTGSISGNKLTVTAVASGCFVDTAGFVTGPGVPTGTYIIAFDQKASIGTFTVAGPGINGSTNVPSSSLTYQRTSLYKMTIFSSTPQTLYLNNIGFTTN